jgi:hypothetical protein
MYILIHLNIIEVTGDHRNTQMKLRIVIITN